MQQSEPELCNALKILKKYLITEVLPQQEKLEYEPAVNGFPKPRINGAYQMWTPHIKSDWNLFQSNACGLCELWG